VKRIIHISVVHTLADLGSLGESVRARYLQRYGAAGWGERQRAVAEFWSDVRRAVGALRLDWRRARIYQDGLPVCGKEEQIVRELAAAGSVNHQLVLELIGKGASLVGTEAPELLLQEYQLQRRGIESSGGADGPRASPGEAADLLAARDDFIARRIDATLENGETGLLFLGAAHRLDALRELGVVVEPLSRS
jgi:hypothetical protein